MIARLDQEIGRLLANLDAETLENTVVIFVGDNGTTGNSIDPPFHPDRAKFTVYEGGVRVPLIIAGPGVPRGRASSALVNTTDLYATIAELAGARVPSDRPVDSVSLLPYLEDPSTPSLREWVYADQFYSEHGVDTGGYAVRDDRYKLIEFRNRPELYDLLSDPAESNDLLADGISEDEQATVRRFRHVVDNLRDEP
jgi:arylsulfatase A-like enzyme